jgi:hypothetical protein
MNNGNRARCFQVNGGSAMLASALSSAGSSGELKISSIGSSLTKPSFPKLADSGSDHQLAGALANHSRYERAPADL